MVGPPRRMWLYHARYRDFGLLYATLAPIRSVATRLSRRLAGVAEATEARLLTIEGERGILGPAHEAYTGHSGRENRAVWSAWDWSRGGEEWDDTDRPAEWRESVVEDVLLPYLGSGGAVLEIGPGAGRWSVALQARAGRLVLVDVTDRALELCRERFPEADNVEYVLTDGATLPGVADRSIDFVWSFDAFVHVAPLDIASYLSEIARVLRPAAKAVIHHSGRVRGPGWRSPMTAPLFARLARERELVVTRQFDSWGNGRFGVRTHQDVITVLESPSE